VSELGLSPKRVTAFLIWLISMTIFEIKTVPFFKGYYDTGWKVGIAIAICTFVFTYACVFAMFGIYIFLLGLIKQENMKEYINAGLWSCTTANVLVLIMYLHFHESSVCVMSLIISIVLAVATGIHMIHHLKF